MNIALLGPRRAHLIAFLESLGDAVFQTEEPLRTDSRFLEGKDFLISYGYRHILRSGVLARFPDRAVNLHISLLPWNRGADPNLWSFLEDTPKGVTVHRIDAGVDTGAILGQREVRPLPGDTLKSSYERMSLAIEALFLEVWPRIRTGDLRGRPQHGEGTCHKSTDKKAYEHLLTKGWDTPVAQVVGKARPPQAISVEDAEA